MRFPSPLFKALALTLPLCGIGGGASAYAAEPGVAAMGPGYSGDGAPLGAAADLEIQLRGEVRPRCRMTTPPALGGRLDFNHDGDTRSSFGLDCNAPFLLRVRSGGGGFVSQDRQEGIAAAIPYEVAVDIDTDMGMNALGWCRSDELTDQQGSACAFGHAGWSSGDATAINRTGTLSLRWRARVEGEPPALGAYRDTIVVDIAVRS